MAHAVARPGPGQSWATEGALGSWSITHDSPVLRALKGVTPRPREGTVARGPERLVSPSPSGPRPQRASPLTLMGVVEVDKPGLGAGPPTELAVPVEVAS